MSKSKPLFAACLLLASFASGCTVTTGPATPSNTSGNGGAVPSAPSNAEKPSDESNFKFKVTNTTDETIVRILASEDGKSFGFFDIGAPLEPGKTIELVWDKKTDDSDCEWFFTAEFKGGTKSKPVNFDFCEENLELEFK